LRTYWADAQSKLARYESFREEDDMTTVISGFLDLPVERFGFGEEWGDTSMFMGYSVQGSPEKEAVDSLSGYIQEERGLHFVIVPYFIYLTDVDYLIFLTKTDLKSACLEWLGANWSGLEKADSADYPGIVLYRKTKGINAFAYDPNKKNVYINYDDIWKFFRTYFGMGKENVSELLKGWLADEYGLTDIGGFPRSVLYDVAV
jgi:hypothetical protein